MNDDPQLSSRMTFDQFISKHGLMMSADSMLYEDGWEKPVVFIRLIEASIGVSSVPCKVCLEDGTFEVPLGRGESMREAINDYAQKISGRILVLDSPGKARREIVVPELLLSEGE